MKNLFALLLSSLLLLIACNQSGDITPADIEKHITFLASDSLQGREAGSANEAIAANYIADHFRDFGLEPAGDNETYFQEFTINTAVLRNPHAGEDAEGEKLLSKNEGVKEANVSYPKATCESSFDPTKTSKEEIIIDCPPPKNWPTANCGGN